LQRKKKLEEIDEQFEELAERLIENPQVGVLEKNGIRNLRKTVSEILD
jgi:hypothetical protein